MSLKLQTPVDVSGNCTKTDLVLLGLDLPDVGGWEVLNIIRLTESLCKTPVIIISGEPPNAAFIDKFNPDGYIQKPFDIRVLLSSISQVIWQRIGYEYTANKA